MKNNTERMLANVVSYSKEDALDLATQVVDTSWGVVEMAKKYESPEVKNATGMVREYGIRDVQNQMRKLLNGESNQELINTAMESVKELVQKSKSLMMAILDDSIAYLKEAKSNPYNTSQVLLHKKMTTWSKLFVLAKQLYPEACEQFRKIFFEAKNNIMGVVLQKEHNEIMTEAKPKTP